MLCNQDRKMVTSIMWFPFLDKCNGYVYTRSKQKSTATSENRYVFITGKRKKKEQQVEKHR